ncbi:dihydrofolate reductase family protein [Streptomyces sp. NPDC047043]|uniref:dihydrofolate reductase family protein n=1 Tax=Streptomyces sp. NPDC047043 TaxID=3154497 RepID=UPI0033CD82A8
MGKLVSTIFVTLDGVYQAPGGPQEDTRGGFEHGGWSFVFGDEDFGRFIEEVFERPAAFLLGRRTYDIFSAYWPKVTDPSNTIAAKLNTLPKYVASSTLSDPEWANTSVLGGDLAKEVTALKERTDGELQVHGSGALVRSLLALDLVDTLHLVTFPVVLGTGFRLFTEGAVPTKFRHTAGRVTAAGVSIQTYDPAGRPDYGSYELPENA